MCWRRKCSDPYHGDELAVDIVVPMRTARLPDQGKQPYSSGSDLTWLRDLFGPTTPLWLEARETQLDRGQEMR
jgi:hypothetical protein